MSETSSLRELLSFYADSGVDEALLDAPVNRFEPLEPPASAATQHERPASAASPRERIASEAAPASRARPAAPSRRASVPDEAQIERARRISAAASSLEALRAALGDFDGCNLKLTAKNLVFGEGDPAADLIFVGRAPERDEDMEGRPFAGRPGQLLDRIMTAMETDRTAVWLTHALPWRPPGAREPTAIEMDICRPFLERQIELVAPKVIVALGGPAAKMLLRSTHNITRLRGTWHGFELGQTVVPLMATFDPDYLMRNPAHKKLAWQDLLEVKAKLREHGAFRPAD